ncbi:MAG: NADPH-dependent FMN reductase [Sphingobium sp.]
MARQIRIVGVGGTLRPRSSTELAIRAVLAEAEALGATTHMFAGPELDLPMYAPGGSDAAAGFIDALRAADAIILGSPGYHGGISGLVKNALDYTEEMAKDADAYFTGKAVGCVATGAGWQGANTTLSALRSVVHALRGWPTPLGIALNSREPLFDADGKSLFPEVSAQFALMAQDLMAFAQRRAATA